MGSNSVSKEHAFLYIYKGRIFVVDEKSKYGVLKQVRENVQLHHHDQTFVINNFKIEIHGLKKGMCFCKKNIKNIALNPLSDISKFE